jgi:hypothetical protein
MRVSDSFRSVLLPYNLYKHVERLMLKLPYFSVTYEITGLPS